MNENSNLTRRRIVQLIGAGVGGTTLAATAGAQEREPDDSNTESAKRTVTAFDDLSAPAQEAFLEARRTGSLTRYGSDFPPELMECDAVTYRNSTYDLSRETAWEEQFSIRPEAVSADELAANAATVALEAVSPEAERALETALNRGQLAFDDAVPAELAYNDFVAGTDAVYRLNRASGDRRTLTITPEKTS